MAAQTHRPRPEGITVRHRTGCLAPSAGAACRCKPAYQAQVFSPRDRRTIRKTFATLAEARAWRFDTQVALRKGTMRAPTRTTLEEAAADWLAAAKDGIARTRSGDPYNPLRPAQLRGGAQDQDPPRARQAAPLDDRPHHRPGPR